MNRHIERQKLLNRLSVVEQLLIYTDGEIERMYRARVFHQQEIAKLNALLAADEEKE
jgi:hypothetical protein